jgi:hypothetical protein
VCAGRGSSGVVIGAIICERRKEAGCWRCGVEGQCARLRGREASRHCAKRGTVASHVGVFVTHVDVGFLVGSKRKLDGKDSGYELQ